YTSFIKVTSTLSKSTGTAVTTTAAVGNTVTPVAPTTTTASVGNTVTPVAPTTTTNSSGQTVVVSSSSTVVTQQDTTYTTFVKVTSTASSAVTLATVSSAVTLATVSSTTGTSPAVTEYTGAAANLQVGVSLVMGFLLFLF
ncbi:hypothetical protein WICPIJ_005731, partial [Wickerhamomyces pijperi]